MVAKVCVTTPLLAELALLKIARAVPLGAVMTVFSRMLLALPETLQPVKPDSKLPLANGPVAGGAEDVTRTWSSNRSRPLPVVERSLKVRVVEVLLAVKLAVLLAQNTLPPLMPLSVKICESRLPVPAAETSIRC